MYIIHVIIHVRHEKFMSDMNNINSNGAQGDENFPLPPATRRVTKICCCCLRRAGGRNYSVAVCNEQGGRNFFVGACGAPED